MATIAAMRVLAHQGGWDEILMVLAPLLIFAGLLVLARRRVDDLDQDEKDPGLPDQPIEDRESTGPT